MASRKKTTVKKTRRTAKIKRSETSSPDDNATVAREASAQLNRSNALLREVRDLLGSQEATIARINQHLGES